MKIKTLRQLAGPLVLASTASVLSACVAEPGATSSSSPVNNTSSSTAVTPNSSVSVVSSSSAASSLSFTPPPEQTPGDPELVMAINAGGGATTLNGIQYQADAYFTGGEIYEVDVDIAGTNEDTVYVTERYNASSYAIPVDNGVYNVVLNFSETYHQVVGERLFNVLAEGQVMLNNVDIFATAGFNAAYDETINDIVVNDGQLNLEFSVVAANPKITGIVVYKQDSVKTHAMTGKEIFDAQCVTCHEATDKAVGTRPDESGHDLQSLITSIQATMPPAVLQATFGTCDAECSYYTAKYIASVNPFFERPLPGPEPDAPIADIQAIPPVMSRLSKFEYSNTIRDLFGLSSDPTADFPTAEPGQFSNENKGLSITAFEVQQVFEIAEDVATQVVEAAANGNRSVISCDINTANCAQTVINQLGVKVWRRPLTTEESADLLALYNDTQTVTRNRETSMAALLRAMLFSPNFFYRPEFDESLTSSQAKPLNAYELASRLSYFIWASTPDDQLLAKAANGSLLNDETIRTEVSRMLADPRAETLVDEFAMTWLDFNKFLKHAANPDVFPQYDGIKEHLLGETRSFLSHIFEDNRPLTEILNADYTYLNGPVANYYGVQGITGNNFRIYEWPAGSKRKGLLGHASALAGHSGATITSPVKRGTWVMDRFLCDRPPEPSADILALFPQLPDGLDSRQISEKHKEASAACAGCHAYVDPIGYGLENFNAVGLWRDEYAINGRTVDSSAELPSGEQFSSLTELADILATRGDVGICSIGYMMSYALGRRTTTVYVPGNNSVDYPAVYDVYQKTLDSAHSIHDIITEIALSPVFRTRMGANSGSQQQSD